MQYKVGFIDNRDRLKMERDQPKPVDEILQFELSVLGRRRPNLGRRRPWTEVLDNTPLDRLICQLHRTATISI